MPRPVARGSFARAARERARRAGRAGGLCLALSAASCAKDRALDAPAPVYVTDVAPILEQRCVECHADAAPAGGWRATSYLAAIACVGPTGAAATLPANATAPILLALDDAAHAGVRLASSERAVLDAWIAAGAPASRGAVHPAGIVDPRADAFHGKQLRAARWTPMLDPADPAACGRCHDGSPSRPAKVTFAAPGATACTTCHSEPGGVLACGTCHGSGARASPPRDPCFFPDDAARAGAHAAHVSASAASATALPCSTCHPAPGADVMGGVHGDGVVDVVLDPARVGGEASYDRTTGTCAVGCHDHGGARSRPKWRETGAMGCGDCHASPPAAHFPGPCTSCHREANAAGTGLSGGPLHLNGRVDLGDGSGACGACHGRGDDPWPATAAHPSHRSPTLTTPVACATCHTVPTAILAAGHLDGVVEIAFTGRARDRAAQPGWDGATCSAVACHGANVAPPGGDPDPPSPAWRDPSGSARACGACHGVPPLQHTTSTACDRAECHGSEVTRSSSGIPSITPSGKLLHIDGVIGGRTP